MLKSPDLYRLTKDIHKLQGQRSAHFDCSNPPSDSFSQSVQFTPKGLIKSYQIEVEVILQLGRIEDFERYFWDLARSFPWAPRAMKHVVEREALQRNRELWITWATFDFWKTQDWDCMATVVHWQYCASSAWSRKGYNYEFIIRLQPYLGQVAREKDIHL